MSEYDEAAMWDILLTVLQQREADYPNGVLIQYKGEVRLYQSGDWQDVIEVPDVPLFVVQDLRDLATLAGARKHTNAEILALIAPAYPEQIEHIGPNVYEARWAPPVPMMDVEILRGTPGVLVLGEPVEVPLLADWIAVRFTIVDLPDELPNT